jgi:hypothetical protein
MGSQAQAIKATTKQHHCSGLGIVEKHPGAIQQVGLDQELAADEQLRQLKSQFEHIDLLIDVVEKWEEHQPPLRITLDKGELSIRAQTKLRLWKTLTIIGGVVGAMWAVVAFLVHNGPATRRF